jgi:PKHD-type hydroxylase
MDLSFRETNHNLGNFYFFEKGVPVDDINAWRYRLSKEKLIDGFIGDSVKNNTVRRSLACFIDPSSYSDVYNAIKGLVENANNTCFKFNLTDMSEKVQYSEYKATDQGFYDWHMDITPLKSRRKLSVVVQLSDESEYDGGELQIQTGLTEPVTMGKTKGLVTVFPSYLLHRVTPVTRGVRRSLVVWIDGPPFR